MEFVEVAKAVVENLIVRLESEEKEPIVIPDDLDAMQTNAEVVKTHESGKKMKRKSVQTEHEAVVIKQRKTVPFFEVISMLLTCSVIQKAEVRGKLLRGIRAEKMEKMNQVNRQELFNTEKATVPIFFVDRNDTTMARLIAVEGNHRCHLLQNEPINEDFEFSCEVVKLKSSVFLDIWKIAPSISDCILESTCTIKNLPKKILNYLMRAYTNVMIKAESTFGILEQTKLEQDFLAAVIPEEKVKMLKEKNKDREDYWEELATKGLVQSGKSSSSGMNPLFIYLCAPRTKDAIFRCFEHGVKIGTANRQFDLLMRMSNLNDDHVSGLLKNVELLKMNGSKALNEKLKEMSRRIKEKARNDKRNMATEDDDNESEERAEEDESIPAIKPANLPYNGWIILKETIGTVEEAKVLKEKNALVIVVKPDRKTLCLAHLWGPEKMLMGLAGGNVIKEKSRAIPFVAFGDVIDEEESKTLPVFNNIIRMFNLVSGKSKKTVVVAEGKVIYQNQEKFF